MISEFSQMEFHCVSPLAYLETCVTLLFPYSKGKTFGTSNRNAKMAIIIQFNSISISKRYWLDSSKIFLFEYNTF